MTFPAMTRPADDGIEVAIVDWSNAREQAMAVRETVFVEEQGVPAEIELDEWDAVCRHALAFAADGGVIATGRLLPDGHIGRMAVLAPWRKQGVGGRVLAALITEAERLGMRELVLNAQVSAQGFYAHFGFVAEGEVFTEAGILHRAMRRRT